MKSLLRLPIFIAVIFLLQACTKTESIFNDAPPETITVSASALSVTAGNAVAFSVLSSKNSNNVTADCKIYVNDSLISGSSYPFSSAGTFTVYATKGALTSNVISVNVTAIIVNAGYKHHVLVEEYSGTWCGNCPRILYGVDLLHKQTDKAIVVSTHLFGGDPFITTDGNNLAAQQGVSGVPTGYINRTISWNGPQYENVAQVVNTIKTSAPVGIAINSTLSNNNILVTVNAAYQNTVTGGAKLTVYLVEDKLTYTQRNYSSNLFDGQASIPNFEYNGVLRKVVSSLSGDVIGATGSNNQKTYTLPIPANIANISNARLVAFITNVDGTVVNVQDVKVGAEKKLESL